MEIHLRWSFGLFASTKLLSASISCLFFKIGFCQIRSNPFPNCWRWDKILNAVNSVCKLILQPLKICCYWVNVMTYLWSRSLLFETSLAISLSFIKRNITNIPTQAYTCVGDKFLFLIYMYTYTCLSMHALAHITCIRIYKSHRFFVFFNNLYIYTILHVYIWLFASMYVWVHVFKKKIYILFMCVCIDCMCMWLFMCIHI